MKVKCDNCGKEDKLKPCYSCPTGWFYAEIHVDGTSDIVVTLVCSKDCALNIWRPGPGPKLTNADFRKLIEDKENIEKAKEIVSMIEVIKS